MNWIFEGIGTQIIGIIISLIIGALGGGAVGYKIGIKRTAKQEQIAGDEAKQKQELHMDEIRTRKNISKNKTNIRQSQEAGNNVVQTQIGEINDVR